MRNKLIKKNTLFAAAYFVVVLIARFFVRTVLIELLGEKYLGLNVLFGNILYVLSVSELGVGGAIIFALYKPVNKDQTNKAQALLKLYKKIFYVIGGVVTGFGLALMPFLDSIVVDAPVGANIYLIYFVFLINTVAGYAFAHARAVMYAYQRNDLETKTASIAALVLAGLQIAVLYIFKDFLLYVTVMAVVTVFEGVVLSVLSAKLTKKADKTVESSQIDIEEKRSIIKNTVAYLAQKFGSISCVGIDSLLILAYFGLAVLGRFSNYHLLIATAFTLINLLTNAIKGSVGSIIVDQNQANLNQSFYATNLFTAWLTAFVGISLLVLSQSFISQIWLDSSYLLDGGMLFFMLVSFYLTAIRSSVNVYRDGAGLYWQSRYLPIADIALNVLFSVILIKPLGISGIFVGTVISQLLTYFWVEPLVLYKHLIKDNIKTYYIKLASYVAVTVVAGAASYFLSGLCGDGTVGFAFKALVCLIVPNLMFLAAFFKTNDFKFLLINAKKAFKMSEIP